MPNLRRGLLFSFIVVISVAIVESALLYAMPTSSSPESVLLVDGFVQRPLDLTIDEIAAMPRSTVNAEIYCLPSPGSSGVLVDKGNWTGVRLGFILEKAGVSPEAVKVAFYATDSFTTDLNVTTAMREDIILAYEKDGKPIPEKIRLVAPGMWGYKWIKWLIHIELMNHDFKGTYESRGFPDNAEIHPPVGGNIAPINKIILPMLFIGVVSVTIVAITVVVKKRRLNHTEV